MSARQPLRIAVAGAGIGGLTTALALLAKGIEVEVFEQASQLAEVGAGLQISPNGVKVLQNLGLTEALLACVSPAQGKEIRMWNTGQRWKLFDLGADCQERFGAPYWMVHRGDLHQVLLTTFAQRSKLPVRLNARVVSERAKGRAGPARGERGLAPVRAAWGLEVADQEATGRADRPRPSGSSSMR
jgi:salicylate hydroxylase